MSDDFDPYYEWFGISPEDRPLNHYLLLGLPLKEGDSKRISNAADQRVAYLRSLAQGKRAKLTQRLLGEVAAAVRCLLDPASKQEYDASLASNAKSSSRDTASAAGPAAGPPVAIPLAPPSTSQSPAPLVDPMAPVQLASDYLAGTPMSPPKPTVDAPPVAGPGAAPVDRLQSPPKSMSSSPQAVAPAINVETKLADAAEPVPIAHGDKSAVDAPPVHDGHPDEDEDTGLATWVKLAIGLSVVLLSASAVIGGGLAMGWFGKDKPAEEEVVVDPPEVIVEEPDPNKPKGNEVAVVTQEGDGGLRFSPSFARVAADIRLVNVEGQMVTRDWSSPEQEVVWRARLVKPGVFEAKITYASASDKPAGQLEIAVNDKTQVVSLRGSGGLDKFVSETFFLAIPRKGVSDIRLKAKQVGEDGFIELRTLECSSR